MAAPSSPHAESCHQLGFRRQRVGVKGAWRDNHKQDGSCSPTGGTLAATPRGRLRLSLFASLTASSSGITREHYPVIVRAQRALLSGAALVLDVALMVHADESPSSTVVRGHQDLGGARLYGLAGAFVGLADDASAGRSNPAGLPSLPRSLDGSLANGLGGPSWRPSFASVAFHPFARFAVALDYGRTEREASVRRPEARITDASTSTSTAGAAFGYRLQRRLSLGFGVDALRLTAYGATAGAGPQRLGTDWRFQWVAGAFFRPDNPDGASFGVTYRHRAEWTPHAGPSATASLEDRIQTPSVFSAGVSWHYDLFQSSRVLFTVQPDVIRYSDLGGSPRPHYDLDLRGGIELSRGFDCLTGCGSMVQARVGLLNRAPVPYASGAGGALAAGQGPGRATSWTLGGSLAHRVMMSGRLKLELAYRRDTQTFIFGVGYRYNEAYRADVQDHRRH